jgi:hypothetical protein
MSSVPVATPSANIQLKLDWIFSVYAGVFAFLFSILIFSPLSGIPFALIAAGSALVCTRIASWIASSFGWSGYGLIACILTTILFPLVPPIVVMAAGLSEYFSEPGTFSEYSVLSATYYLLGIIYTAPAALAGTAIFHAALLCARKLHWLSLEQRWL